MTAVEVSFQYSGTLHAHQVRALANAFSVYGIRNINVDEAAHRLTIEYDATRMNEDRVAAIVRGCGIAITAA